jgi:hypothetical protein
MTGLNIYSLINLNRLHFVTSDTIGYLLPYLPGEGFGDYVLASLASGRVKLGY